MMSKSLRRRLAMGLAACLMVALAAMLSRSAPIARSAGQSTSATSASSRVLHVVQQVEVLSLDPNVQAVRAQVRIGEEILETPTRYVSSGSGYKLVPWLTSSWSQVSPRRWRFTVRKGIKFSNGEPLTSAAFVKTWQYYNKYKAAGGGQAVIFSNVLSMLAVDQYHFDLSTTTPNDEALPSQMSVFYVYPPTEYGQVGAAGFGAHPIGTGPYLLASWQKGVALTLKANPSYWGPKPAIKQIVFTSVLDASTRLSEVQSGQADVAADVPPDLIPRAKGISSASIEATTQYGRFFLAFNVHSRPANRPVVRQAINYAIDRQAIVKSLLGGYATATYGLYVPNELGYTTKRTFPYNVSKAKQLLAKAGFPNGVTIDLSYATDLGQSEQLAQVIQSQLGKAGIKVVLHSGLFSAQAKSWETGKTPGMVVDQYQSLYPDTSFLFVAYLTAKAPWGGLAIDNPTAAIATKAISTANKKRRQAFYEQANQRAIGKLALWVPLFAPQGIYLVSKDLKWSPRADTMFRFETAAWK
jgi:peptide/nickel transport system substrate-binding protein